MANWIHNELTIELEDNSLLEKIEEKLKGDNGSLDFNKVIPMPKTMNVESGSLEGDRLKYFCLKTNTPMPNNLGKYRLYQMVKKDGTAYTLKDYEEFLEHHEHQRMGYCGNPNTKEAWLKEGKKIYINITKYGYKDWYDWSNAKWNTKWNASNVEIDKDPNQLVYTFSTAWAPPYPIAKEISRKYKANVTLFAYDEDDLSPYMEYTYSNGEETAYNEYPREEEEEE